MQVSEYSSRHLPIIVRLLNEEYINSHGFIQFNEERVLSEIRKRNLKVLVAEENGKPEGLIASHFHADESSEEHVTWLAAQEGARRKFVEDSLVREVEKNTRGRAVMVMIEAGSPKTADWISRGYTLCPGYQQMIARLDSFRPIPNVAEGVRLRSLRADEEEELISAVNRGFGWTRLEPGVLETWRSDDPPFDEGWVQVAEAEGRIVSAVVARPDTDYVEYSRLKRGHLGPAATLPEFRNKHLASALTAKAMNLLYEKGMDSVRLGTSEENVSSITLLRKLGFQVDVIRKTLHKELKAKQ